MATKFSFLISPEGEIEGLLSVTRPYGPGSEGFSEEMEFTLSPIVPIVAPCDCRAWIVPKGMGENSPGYRIKMVPIFAPYFQKLYQQNYLSEIPTSFWLDGIDFVGSSQTYIETSPETKFGPPSGASWETTHWETTRDEVIRGNRYCSFKRGDLIALSMEGPVSFKIETSKRIGEEGFNTFDPFAFYTGLLRSNGNIHDLEEGLADKLQRWLTSVMHVHGGLLIEVRDEYNERLHSNHSYSSSGFSISHEDTLLYETSQNALGAVRIDLQSGSLSVRTNQELIAQGFQSGPRRIRPNQRRFYGSYDFSLPLHLVFWLIVPSRWFYNRIVEERIGEIEDGYAILKQYTLGNEVTPLVDGPLFFADVYREIQRLDPDNPNHYFHILGWYIDPVFDFAIAPEQEVSLKTAFSSFEGNPAASRLKAIIYDLNTPTERGVGQNEEENIAVLKDEIGFQVIHDDKRLPESPDTSFDRTEGDHHMKVISLSNSNGQVSYCGGMDFHENRLDTRAHGEGSLGIPDKLHDIQLRVSGPAAYELEKVFYNRWMDWRSYEENGQLESIPMPVTPPEDEWGCMVQVATTIPSSTIPSGGAISEPYKFAPQGDRTIYETLMRAIQNARQYIYIEDQFFSNPEICSLIKSKLNDLQFVVLIGPGPYLIFELMKGINSVPKIVGEITGKIPVISGPEIIRKKLEDLIWSLIHSQYDINYDEFRRRLLDQESPENKAKVKACYLKNEEGEYIFPHSKVVIIDDIFVSCGSANIDLRGMGNIDPNNDERKAASTECNLMCIDTSVLPTQQRRFARDFRLRLWYEHAGYPLRIGEKIEAHPLFHRLVDPVMALRKYWTREGRIKRVGFY